jgi:glycosyltransferase involved in cell wall biosynthesis
VAALGHVPDVHLAVVTVPFPHPFAANLRAAAERVGAVDRLHLVPPVPSVTVPAYLREADVAVSPILPTSASYDMALPNKLFEFLHAGLPMVVSDCKAMAAFVAEHGLGRSFRAGDAADLGTALTSVLADPPRPDTAALRREFSWQAQEARLVGAYAGLVEGLTTPSGPFPADEVALDWRRG